MSRPCRTCARRGWLLTNLDTIVERCEACKVFETDLDAAGAALLEVSHLPEAERAPLVTAVIATCIRYLEG